jgi:hypothetical protein
MTLSDSGAADAAPADDLRASLEAAFDSTPEEQPGIGHNGGPEIEGEARDPETGRFTAKTEDAPAEGEASNETTDQPAEVKPEEAAAPPIPAPASWSAAEKASWDKLPREAQEAIQRRESDVTKGFQERAEQVKAFEPLRQVLAPHADRLTKTGRSPVEVIGQLLDVHAGLESSPYEVFPIIARMYGIDLSRIVPGAGAANGQVDGADNPVVAHLMQQVQQLQSRLQSTEQFQTQQQRAASEALQQRASDEYAAFTTKAASDYPHFEAVRADMAKLIQSGVADTLTDAYDKAVWARPDIRERILTDQRKADEAKRLEDQRKTVAAAKARGTSVRTNPTTVAPVAAEAGSLRAELERAFDG